MCMLSEGAQRSMSGYENTAVVPVVEFEYPDDDRTDTQSPLEYCAQGFRMAAEYFAQAKGARACRVRVAVALHIITRSNEPIATLAKRLRVSREHVSRELARFRRLKPLV